MIPGIIAGLIAGGGGGIEVTGITWTQSSTYSGVTSANATNMRDANIDASAGAATGTATFGAGDQWIKADLGSAKSIAKITLGGGNLGGGWGDSISPYLNGHKIQYSTDDITYTDAFAISGVTDTMPLDKDFSFGPVSAQYWRIQAIGAFAATATFRLYE